MDGPFASYNENAQSHCGRPGRVPEILSGPYKRRNTTCTVVEAAEMWHPNSIDFTMLPIVQLHSRRTLPCKKARTACY